MKIGKKVASWSTFPETNAFILLYLHAHLYGQLKLLIHVYCDYIFKEVLNQNFRYLKSWFYISLFFYKINRRSIPVRNDIRRQGFFPLSILLQWLVLSNVIINDKLKKYFPWMLLFMRIKLSCLF